MPTAPAKPRQKSLDFALPVKGVYRGNPWSKLPEGYAVEASNVLPNDGLGRNRPGTRPGVRKYLNFQFGGGAVQFQHVSMVNVQDTSAGTGAAKIIVVAGGKAYVQSPNDAGPANRIDGGGAATFVPGTVVSVGTFENISYFTDGRVVKKYDHGSGAFADWLAVAGTFPNAGSGDKYPRGLCVWRGRMVLVHLDKGLASTVFFTRQGDPTDFDYGATPVDPTIAVATDDNFRAGQLGEPVTCAIPVSEDVLLIGMANSISAYVGDPADGGSMVNVSTAVGMLSFFAACMVNKTVYFIGTGGFFRWTMGTEAVCLSRYATNEVWRNLPQVGYFTSMAYDAQLHGIWIFVTHATTTFGTKHYFYDLKTEDLDGRGGFWPIAFPVDTGGDDNAAGTTAPTMDPTRACNFEGFDGTYDGRCVLMGGRDGYLRTFDYTPLVNDDGQAISSFCWFGPIQAAGPSRTFMVNGWKPVLGEQSNVNATWTLKGGPDPYTAFNSPTISKTGTFTTGGRQSPRGERINANAIFLKVENATLNKSWAIERVTAEVEDGGLNR